MIERTRPCNKTRAWSEPETGASFHNDSPRQENQKYLRLSAKPRRSYELAKKKWSNRKTTKYFRCKNCGQELSVPRGKGTMRVVCPKCKTETKMKS